MTATPIPRTLALTFFGDMDVSPCAKSRRAASRSTRARSTPSASTTSLPASAARFKAGARVYWVCPLVAESEDSDLAAAQERAEDLAQFFGDTVGLAHGQMKGRDKDAAMEAFARGETKFWSPRR